MADKSEKLTSSKVSAKNATPSVLPLPHALWDHHLEVLKPYLQHFLKRGSLPQALLLTGPRGIGKRAVAHAIAQRFLCATHRVSNATQQQKQEDTLDLFGLSGAEDTKKAKNAEPAPAKTGAELCPESRIDACRSCIPCSQIERSQNVDFIELLAQNEDDPTGLLAPLKIEAFRDLKGSMGFGAFNGNCRIILIANAERMTTQATNSVLKLIEEPPAGWHFILTSGDPLNLLPTLRSRCLMVGLRPMSDTNLRAALQTHFGVDSRTIAQLPKTFGCWERAAEHLATWSTGGPHPGPASAGAAEGKGHPTERLEDPIVHQIVQWIQRGLHDGFHELLERATLSLPEYLAFLDRLESVFHQRLLNALEKPKAQPDPESSLELLITQLEGIQALKAQAPLSLNKKLGLLNWASGFLPHDRSHPPIQAIR